MDESANLPEKRATKQIARKSTGPSFPVQSSITITRITNSSQPLTPNNQAINQATAVAVTAAIPTTTVNKNETTVSAMANSIQFNTSSSVGAAAVAAASTATIGIGTDLATQKQQQPPQPPLPQKLYRNKIVLCKPFYQSKATECHPFTQDASTQVSLDDIQLTQTIVPVPVPIYIPVPICMYQAPVPVPLIAPVPIPVPIFIPTTKRTFDRVERRIKKLRKKLSSDPYEFELLMYAEKLAREEGIQGFEESSDGDEDDDSDSGENRTEKKNNTSVSSSATGTPMMTMTANKLSSSLLRLRSNNENSKSHPHDLNHLNQSGLLNEEGPFKWFYGVRIFHTWLAGKIESLKSANLLNSSRLPDDLHRLKNDELNICLAEFIQEIRKPTGETYAPESIYYLCLGIQYYLQEKGRLENIFLDYHLFDKFQESFNEIAMRYQIRINAEGHIVSRIEEEILWESKQLGAHSPFVLLYTILYINTKYFFLDKLDAHMHLSFTNVKKHSKRNIGPNGEDFGKTMYLRYYPDFQGVEQVIYEQGENYDNPLRCPVSLYNFYLSKCPENVKHRSDVFYLLPEKVSLPNSPVWFSSQPLNGKLMERMLNRAKMVKEVNELLVAASPAGQLSSII